MHLRERPDAPATRGPVPAEWRIVALFSIVALGILSLLMIDVWALDPMVYCPGAFPPSRSCSARPLWFLLALLWAGAAVGVAGLCLVQIRRRRTGRETLMPPSAALVTGIFLLCVGAFTLWADNEVSYYRLPSLLRDAVVFAYVTAALVTLPATFLNQRTTTNPIDRGGRWIAAANGLFGFTLGFNFAYFAIVGCNCVT